jgi:hypothetical protein
VIAEMNQTASLRRQERRDRYPTATAAVSNTELGSGIALIEPVMVTMSKRAVPELA